MNKFTIQQRIEIYQIALAQYVRDNGHFYHCRGLCNVISHVAFDSGYTNSRTSAYDDMPTNYPEVYAQKPDSFIPDNFYWFSRRNAEGGQIRIKILEKAIADCNLFLS